MTTIDIGSEIGISFSFSYNGDLLTPDTLIGEIFKDEILDSTFSPTFISTGLYSYEWTPTEAGPFEIRLTGEYDDSTPDIIHNKYFLIGDVVASETLVETNIIYLLGQLSPLYMDPSIILQFFSSGDLIEITEIIHRKSLELENKLGCEGLTTLTQMQSDFILASTMCELSRIYGVIDSGFGGFGGADSFKLGDLEVDKSSSAGSSKYDLGNASTWCELANALKNQLLSGSARMRPVVPGSAYAPVIPTRGLGSSDF